MTRQEVRTKLSALILEQLGRLPHMANVEGDLVIDKSFASLQEALGCTSLETVSVQMAMEETFSLKFATGHADRGQIDAEWDACRSEEDLVELVLKFRC